MKLKPLRGKSLDNCFKDKFWFSSIPFHMSLGAVGTGDCEGEWREEWALGGGWLSLFRNSKAPSSAVEIRHQARKPGAGREVEMDHQLVKNICHVSAALVHSSLCRRSPIPGFQDPEIVAEQV